MFNSWPAALVTAYFGAATAGFAGVIAGAFINDFKWAQREHAIHIHPYSKQNRVRPLFTVIITASHSHALIEQCLESVVKNNYRKYELIAVNSAGDDNITKIINNFKSKYPKKTIKRLVKRNKIAHYKAFESALKKLSHGDIIIKLNADQTLDKHALRNASRYFNSRQIRAVVPGSYMQKGYSSASLIEEYLGLLNEIINKTKNSLGLLQINKNTQTFYRKISKDSPKKTNKIVFGSNIKITSPPVGSYRGLIKNYYNKLAKNYDARLSSSISTGHADAYKKINYNQIIYIFSQLIIAATPILVTFLLYLAIMFKQPSYIFVWWALITCVLLIAVINSSHSLKSKIELVVLLLPMPLLFYFASIARLIIIFTVAAKWLGTALIYGPISNLYSVLRTKLAES